MSNNPRNINQTVLRGAKQIYTHLRLKERIALLSNTPLPVEITKLQTLLARTNKGMVENTVRKFISWTAPNKRQKTLEDFVNLVDEHLVDEVDFGDDLDEEFLVQLHQQNTMVQRNNLGTPQNKPNTMIDNSVNNSSHNSIVTTRPPVMEQNTKKRAGSLDDFTEPDNNKKIKTVFKPNFSAQECFAGVNENTGAHNIICSPTGGTKFFENVPWIILFEISRFIQSCKVPWHELPIAAFQNFINIGTQEPKKLYETMVKWNQEQRLGLTLNGLAYTSMDRCPEAVWSYLQKQEKELQEQNQHIYDTTTNEDPAMMLSPMSPTPSGNNTSKKVSKLKNRMIHYSGILQFKLSTAPPNIILRAPKIEASNRFFRKFGYERFLELKLTKSTKPFLVNKHRDFFLKPFLFMHRVFRFLFIKDDTVILFATEGPGLTPITIQQVVEWHMPIIENWNMSMSKYASRMSLGYSSSVSTLQFKPEEIQYIDDIYATTGSNGGIADETLCMTDGCGIISPAAMKSIMGCQATDQLPCAIQGRIAGAKGIWIIDPKLDFSAGNYIQIRSSQAKFKTGLPQDDLLIDPLHYTFDHVKNSVCVYPSNLNTQFIQSLAAGGVPTSVFVEILKEYTHRLASVITENQNVKILRDWVAARGNIMNSRWEGETHTEKGLWHDLLLNGEDENDSGFFSIFDDDDDEEDTNSDEVLCGGSAGDLDCKISTSFPRLNQDAVAKTNSYNKINRYSGLPAGLHESIIRLLDAGFDLSNAYVATRVTQVFRQVMKSITTKYKIEVPQSCTVTCVPDPTNTLKPGEIFLQLSSRKTDEKTGIRAGQILGDCIVTRNPCGLKSDVQKVKAVDCTNLRMYTDVVIFSVQGEVSLASKLSGGDYDGDIVFCCWDERIVEPFRSSPVPSQSERVDKAFIKDKTTVGQIIGNHTNTELAIQQSFIAVSLPDGTLGTYENWRTVLAEHKSLDDPDVIYLAHMCAKLVDASKQGLKLTSYTKTQDINTFGGLAHPTWFMDKKNKQREPSIYGYKEVNNVYTMHKEKAVTTMDHLFDTLMKETAAFTRYSRSLFSEEDVPYKDNDLSEPWMKAMKIASLKGNELFRQDLDLIAESIKKNRDTYNQQVQEFQLQRTHYRDNIWNPTRYVDNQFVDDLLSRFNNFLELEEYFAKEYNEMPDPKSLKSSTLIIDVEVNNGKMLQTLKASYAYTLGVNTEKYGKYPYIVAYDALRRIKGDATALAANKENGLAETVSLSTYKSMNIDRKWIKRIKETSYVEKDVEKVRLVPDLQKQLYNSK